MNIRDYPATMAAHLARRLAELPGGTRVALVWDPEGHVPAGVDVVDQAGQAWQTHEFAGDDARFAGTWAVRKDVARSIVLLRLPQRARAGPLDISFQDRLLQEADALLDMTLTTVLREHTGVRWNGDAVRATGPLIVRNLAGTLIHLQHAGSSGIVGERELKAAALAAAIPGARGDDFLRPPAGGPADVLMTTLRRLVALPESAREQARSLLAEGATNPAVRYWLRLSLDQSLAVLVVGVTLAALNRPLDGLAMRGAGVDVDATPLLSLLATVLAGTESASVARELAAGAEQAWDSARLDRLVSGVGVPNAAQLGAAVEALTPRVRDALLRRWLIEVVAPGDMVSLLGEWPVDAGWDAGDPAEDALRGHLAAAVTRLARVGRRLKQEPVGVDSLDALADAYVGAALPTMELDLAQAMEHIRRGRDVQLTAAMQPKHISLRARSRTLLDRWDHALAATIADVTAFNSGERSISNLLRVEVIGARRMPPIVPHVWLVIFDGMRWDTWQRVIRPALTAAFESLVPDRPHFALLPSTTGISRTAAMAGETPAKWLNSAGMHTSSEDVLGPLGFRLAPEAARTEWRLIKRADEDVDLWVADTSARQYNTIVYNISDDRIHHFSQDVADLNIQLRQRIVDRVLQDLLTAVQDGDLLVVTSDHGFIEMDRDGGVEIDVPGATVNYRFVAGAAVPGYPSVDHGREGTYSMAVGRRWFQRAGGTFARYSHGGVSFDELLVPGAVFRHSGVARLDLRWSPAMLELSGVEGEPLRGTAELVNAGNRPVHISLKASHSDVTLSPSSALLAVRDRLAVSIEAELPVGRVTADVTATYGVDSAAGHELPPLALGLLVTETPGRVTIDFSALDLFDKDDR